jgi:hypothetical protein
LYDAVCESVLIEELELGARIGWQRRVASAENHGPDEQLALVETPGLEGVRREVRTSDGRSLLVAAFNSRMAVGSKWRSSRVLAVDAVAGVVE